MSKDEALTLALEALENTSTALREDDVLGSDIELMLNAITAVTEALAQPWLGLTAQQRESYQKGHNDGVAHHKQVVKAAQPSEDATIIQYHEATIKRLEKRIEEMEAQPEQEQKLAERDVHTEHCYQDEYEHGCKYGEGDFCTAKPEQENT